MIFGFYVRN